MQRKLVFCEQIVCILLSVRLLSVSGTLYNSETTLIFFLNKLQSFSRTDNRRAVHRWTYLIQCIPIFFSVLCHVRSVSRAQLFNNCVLYSYSCILFIPLSRSTYLKHNLKTDAAISNAHLSRVCKRGKLSGFCLSTINGFGSTQLSDILMSYCCSDIFLTK